MSSGLSQPNLEAFGFSVVCPEIGTLAEKGVEISDRGNVLFGRQFFQALQTRRAVDRDKCRFLD